MPTTSNFGWTTPADTDLVKDGAAAIRTLGNGIDTSLVDLKGGTTGQVLSKASNTDLDYTWVTTDDANAIQNAIVDAKGDLIAASAADTPARLAVGSNGETLVADSSASTGLRWQGNFAAGKNKIINGDFGIWQRGTSFTNPAGGSYTADRIRISDTGGSPTSRTVSQQTFTAGTAPVAGYEGQYFYRSTLTTVGSSTAVRSQSMIEDVRTLANQTVTLSFWAKSDSTRTQPAPNISQNFGSGGSTSVDTDLTSFETTTSWQRFSFSFTMPSISGKTIGTGSHLRVSILQNLTDGSVLDMWGLQLEAGSVATAFQTATGTLAGELAACQRYYHRTSCASVGYQRFSTSVGANSTTVAYPIIPLPVTLRALPTSIDYSLTGLVLNDGGTNTYAVTGLTIDSSTGANLVSLTATVASGLTQFRPYYLNANNSSSPYIGFSAEL